jgi:hypothetical protein
MATINGNPQGGSPAIRLASFLGHFGSRGRFYSICQSDYSAALTDLGRTMFNAMSPCIEGDILTNDTDPSNPGTQLACTVSDVVDAGSATQTQTVIPACKMLDATTPSPDDVPPCWYPALSPTDCPSPDSGFEVEILRDTVAPPAGDVVEIECAVRA